MSLRRLTLNFVKLLLCLIGLYFAIRYSSLLLGEIKYATTRTEKLGVALAFAMICIPIIGAIGMALLTLLEIYEEYRRYRRNR